MKIKIIRLRGRKLACIVNIPTTNVQSRKFATNKTRFVLLLVCFNIKVNLTIIKGKSKNIISDFAFKL